MTLHDPKPSPCGQDDREAIIPLPDGFKFPTPLAFAYDPVEDIMVIEGVRYSGSFFRELGNNGIAVGEAFTIQRREQGLVTIARFEAGR